MSSALSTPAPSAATAAAGGTPTAKESEFMFRVVQNMNAKPEVDWDAVAAAMCLKSGKVAQIRFGQIKNKYADMSSASSGVGSGTNVTPSKLTKVTAATAAVVGGDCSPKAPKKKAVRSRKPTSSDVGDRKKGIGKKTVGKAVAAGDEGDSDGDVKDGDVKYRVTDEDTKNGVKDDEAEASSRVKNRSADEGQSSDVDA